VWVCLCASAQQLSQGVSVENLIDAGHWKRARQSINARLRANSNDAFALYLSSKIEASFGNLEHALELAERSVALEPHSSDSLSQAAEMHARLADRVSVVKQVIYVRKLKKEIETALALSPKHVDTRLVQIMFLWRAPVYAGGDKKRALVLAEQLTAIDPGWGNLIKARMGEESGDLARVERALLNALQTKPNYLATYSLAKFYCCVSKNPQLDLAERIAREAIQSDSGQAGAYEILARVFAHQQRWSELENILVEAEAKVPDDLTPYYYAARTLLDAGQDFPRAERYIRKYLSQDPEGREPTLQDARQVLAAVIGSKQHPAEAGL
jgi:tetratricopeptide (TPR) repeat protein